MGIYLIMFEAWNHFDMSVGVHRPTFAVRAYDPEDLRSRLHGRPVGFNPTSGTYSLKGGLGRGSVLLDEWTILSIRKSRGKIHSAIWRELELCSDCMMFASTGEHSPDRLAERSKPLEWCPGDLVIRAPYARASNAWDRDQSDLCARPCGGCLSFSHEDRFAAYILRQKAGEYWVEDI